MTSEEERGRKVKTQISQEAKKKKIVKYKNYFKYRNFGEDSEKTHCFNDNVDGKNMKTPFFF